MPINTNPCKNQRISQMPHKAKPTRITLTNKEINIFFRLNFFFLIQRNKKGERKRRIRKIGTRVKERSARITGHLSFGFGYAAGLLPNSFKIKSTNILLVYHNECF